MKTFNFFISVYLVVVLFFSSCQTSLKLDKPTESYLPATIKPAVSELPLQIEIDVKKLEVALNKQMTGLLFQGDKLNGQDISVKVWKAQNVSFTIKNNLIEYRVPLKVWSQFAWSVEKFGLTVSDKYTANGSIALSFSTAFDIDKNWKLVAKTTSSGYQWLETPKINVLGVNVPVTPIADYALKRSQEMITEQIDLALAQMVDLKKYAAMAWTEMQKPVQISTENNVWIKVTPQDILLSPFQTQGSKLKMVLSLKAMIESYMGVKPETAKAIALPPFKRSDAALQEFNLNIAADATFEKISDMAKTQLLNKTFSEGKKSITIKGLTVFGNQGKAVFVADVTGSVKGRIYFNGNLVYNPDKIAVEVQNPSFDIKTQNALLKSANWLLNGIIIKKITPYLTYPVKDELEMAKNQVNNTLTNYKIYEGVTLNGKLNTLTVTGLDLVPGAVRINANLKGTVGVKVDEIGL